MANLSGKTAVVTGGSRGIGAAVARRLAADGADVVITYASRVEAAARIVSDIAELGRTGHAIQVDACDRDMWRAAIAEAAGLLGGLDILVFNAGISGTAGIDAASEESFRRLFGVNVEATFLGMRAALPFLRDGGRVVVIGGIVGNATHFPGLSIYGATKAAVAGLARGWARDLGPRGICVNVIQPGPVLTDMIAGAGEFLDVMKARSALGRIGRAEEVAALASFLASDEASYITGASIPCDGGFGA